MSVSSGSVDAPVAAPTTAEEEREPFVASDAPAEERPPRASRAPLVLVGLAVAFNLWTLRGETVPTQTGNDSNLHEAMVRWAVHQIDGRHSVLDGWFPDFGLGFPQFHQYQSLPHIVTAYVSKLFGVQTTYAWSLYLLLALWPICVYVTVRLFGLSGWAAGAAAAIAPLLVAGPASTVVAGFGYENASYIWRGHGLWAQLWGMWLLPLSLALTWRAIARRDSLALAAVVTGLTVACHLITGYLALAAIGLWVVLVPSQLRSRLGRGLIVGVGSLVVIAWMIVPFLTDRKYAVYAVLRGSIGNTSYGAAKTASWLVTGEFFDSGRVPVITLFVGVGAIVCATRWRRDEASRAVLAFFLMSLLLFSGRPVLGAVIPNADEIYFPRFIIGVHLGGIILAGIGAAWLGHVAIAALRRPWPRLRPVALTSAAVVVFVAVLAPAWTERAAYADGGRRSMEEQRAADAGDGADLAALIAIAAPQGGRIYAGLGLGTGNDYRVGYVPVYAEIINRGVPGFGYLLRVFGVSTAVEPLFNASSRAHLDLFNVAWAILPVGVRPPPGATAVTSRGRHQLWKLSTSTGYLEVVDTIGPPIIADRKNLQVRVQGWMSSALLGQRKFPTVAFGGEPGAAPTLQPGQAVQGRAGEVLAQYSLLDDGEFGGQVSANRPAVVLLKATYHPRWQVTVDGKPARAEFIAPSFVGVKVPAGQHTVVFHYRPYPNYPLLFLLSAVGIAGLLLADNLLRKRPDSAIASNDDEEFTEGDAQLTEGDDAEFTEGDAQLTEGDDAEFVQEKR
jgi:hypothetical protein